MEMLTRFLERKSIKEKEKFFQTNGGLILQQLCGRERYTHALKTFTIEELKKATNNYHDSRIIGQGQWRTVYKGFLNDNREVAIKKCRMADQYQIEASINEVVVISQINHKNAVRQLGCCLETQVPLLVCEFINNGCLFDQMHNTTEAFALSWDTRLGIAIQIAGVLSYLHSIFVIHGDVKSLNVLLDSNYTAKLCNFGLSRLVPLNQTKINLEVYGTLGYLDPEYFYTSQLTMKSDVYSFGLLLVELLTGEKALSFDRPQEMRNLAAYFISSQKEDCLFQLLDDHIVCEGNIVQLKEVSKLAARCLNLKGEERPTMEEVAMELEGLRIA